LGEFQIETTFGGNPLDGGIVTMGRTSGVLTAKSQEFGSIKTQFMVGYAAQQRRAKRVTRNSEI